MIQVLGAVAHGELKAHEGLVADAEETADEQERERLLTFAGQELRHHRGFVARLEAIGADPERAMRPYRRALDTYHGRSSSDPIDEAVWAYLGEGVADDLLEWLRTVVDADTAAFIDTVIADEEQHEEHATDELRHLLDTESDGRQRARRAARSMIAHMLASGAGPEVRFSAVAGKTYSLLYRDDLAAGTWLKLKDVPAPAATSLLDVTDSTTDGSATRFYRIATPAAP